MQFKYYNNRRNFIRKAAMGSLMALSIPEIVAASFSPGEVKKIIPGKGNVILFQGDSITDAGRNRDDNSFNNPVALGSGYAMLAGAALLEKYSGLDLKIHNKGISGNKVYQLAERWDKDCLDLKPDILSILIGVNDIWHKLNGDYKGTVDIYRNDYIALLDSTRKALPDVKLVICEPFAVPEIQAVDDKWYPEFYSYQKAAREIADKFGALFIPYQKIFDEAQKQAPGSYWTPDGVHPSLAGAQLMASAWLEVVK
ncbi:MAG: SGNH/GDSL hydrolase family protein [Bacteroidales bacterium]|nr:SGNH/GDSL hydrolase family protein [Bacteroidales bacterium]